VPQLQAKGWWGRKRVVDPLTGNVVVAELGTPSRLQTIYRTNMQTAYAAGQWDAIEQQADLAPFLLYDAVDDFRTRPEHAAWDGTVLPVTDPWWQTHYPPNGWNCRCSVIQLDADEVAELGLAPARKAPKDGTYAWDNPRTGKRQRIPKGIDPGWNVNSGEARSRALRDQVDSKLKGYAMDFARSAAVGFRAAIDAGKAAAAAATGSATAANLGHLARTTTRNATRAAQATIDAALEAGGDLAVAIKALLRTKAGKAMGPVELLAAATARAEAERARMLGDLDGF
jgi:SPP1 gp7 family putative phage head morphogenesis protein